MRRTFVSSREEDSGYRRVSPRATRRRCVDETREGFKKKRTFRRFRGAHDTKKKGETSERRLRSRPRRLGDARYHRASVRQRARGVGRGHDHEQVHDVSLARQVVQQERHRVFGVRRVLDRREKNPRRLSRRRRAKRGRRRRGKRVGGHSPRFRALAGRVARRLTRGGLGGSGGTGHLARLQSARVRVELTNGGLESPSIPRQSDGKSIGVFSGAFRSGAFSSLFRFAPITSEARAQSPPPDPKPPCLTPPPPSRPPRYVAGAHQKPPDSCAAGALASSRVSNHPIGRSSPWIGFVSEISLGRAFSIERASPTDGRLLHDTHTNRARSSRRSTWTSSPSPAATSWICARPNTTTACISTA